MLYLHNIWTHVPMRNLDPAGVRCDGSSGPQYRDRPATYYPSLWQISFGHEVAILWMEEILHHLGWLKPSKWWGETIYQLVQDFFRPPYVAHIKNWAYRNHAVVKMTLDFELCRVEMMVDHNFQLVYCERLPPWSKLVCWCLLDMAHGSWCWCLGLACTWSTQGWQVSSTTFGGPEERKIILNVLFLLLLLLNSYDLMIMIGRNWSYHPDLSLLALAWTQREV